MGKRKLSSVPTRVCGIPPVNNESVPRNHYLRTNGPQTGDRRRRCIYVGIGTPFWVLLYEPLEGYCVADEV